MYAQPTAGSFIVKVADQTDAALPGVDVELQIEGQPPRTGVTNPQGEFAFTNLPPGRAELVCKLINFATVRRDVAVTPGPMARITVVMHLSLNADVIVTGQSTFRNIADLDNPAENLVGVESAASQGAITARQLEARPIMRPGEVLETVPGLIVSQHSGEGKQISITSAASISITGSTSRRRSQARRSICRRMGIFTAIRIRIR